MTSPIEKDLADLCMLAKSLCAKQQNFRNAKLTESYSQANDCLQTWEKDANDLLSQLWNPPVHLRLTPLPNAVSDTLPIFPVNVRASGSGSPTSKLGEHADEKKEAVQLADKVPNRSAGNMDDDDIDGEETPAKKSDGLDSGTGERLSGSSGSTVFHTPESTQNKSDGVASPEPETSDTHSKNEASEDTHSNSHAKSEHSDMGDVGEGREASTPCSKHKSSDAVMEERAPPTSETHSMEDKEEDMLGSADMMVPSTEEDDNAQFETAHDTMDVSDSEEPDSKRMSPTHSSPVPEEKKESPVGLDKPPPRISSGSLDVINRDQSVDGPQDADMKSRQDRKRLREEDSVSPLSSKETMKTADMRPDEQENPGKRRGSPSRKKSVSFKVPTPFSVGQDGKISLNAINALQKIATVSATSLPKTPTESRVAPRIGAVSAKSTASSSTQRTGLSHMRGTLKFSSKRSSLLAHTPGALPPLPPSSKKISKPAARGKEESDFSRFASISEEAPSQEGNIQSSFETIVDKENDGNSDNMMRGSQDTYQARSPMSSKGMSLSKRLKADDHRQISKSNDPKQSLLTGILRKEFLDRDDSGSFNTPRFDLGDNPPKTERVLVPHTLSHIESAGPKSEARQQIERIRAERIAARGRPLSCAQPSNDQKMSLNSLSRDSERGDTDVAVEKESNELPSKEIRVPMPSKDVGDCEEENLGSSCVGESKISRQMLQKEPVGTYMNRNPRVPKIVDQGESVDIISKKSLVGTNNLSVSQSPQQEVQRHHDRQKPVNRGEEDEVQPRVDDCEDDDLGSSSVAEVKFSRLKLQKDPVFKSMNHNHQAPKTSDQVESADIISKKSLVGTNILSVSHSPKQEVQRHNGRKKLTNEGEEDEVEPRVPNNIQQKPINVVEDTIKVEQDSHSGKPFEESSSGLLNLVTSVTSFLPGASSLLGIRAQEEREEVEDSEAAMKRQKLDAERREAEVQARREAMRIAKQKEMDEKQRRVEANRRLRAEEDRVREEERKKKEERRIRKKQEEEEGRRRKKMEEDKKREQRRKQVLLHKRKMEKERENEAKRQKREKGVGAPSKNTGRTNKLGGGGGAESSQSGSGWEHGSPSDSLPPIMNRTPKGNRRPLEATGPSNYVITPANETLIEGSDEENERRRGKSVPKWAESDKVMTSVKNQADPDDLFAPGPMCDLSDVFGDQRKYRTRSSSGNWMQDRLTAQERLAYKKATRDLDNS